MSRLAAASLLSFCVLLWSGSVFAHGGVRVKPANVPTGVGPPIVVNGPMASPTGPGSAKARRPAGRPATTVSSAGARAPSGNRGSVSRTSGSGTGSSGAISYALDAGSWELWWVHNRDRFLRLRSHLVDRAVVSGSVSAFTGRGRRVQASNSYRPTTGAVDGRIVPALLGMLSSDDPDILDSAVLAAARSARASTADEVFAAVTPQLGSKLATVQSSAALSLGVLAHEDVRSLLKPLVRDDSHGRQIAGGKVPDMMRAFAALSLGLAGKPSDAIMLADVVRRTPDRERDLKLCAVIALGMLGAQDEVSSGVQAILLDLLADERLDPGIRNHVPTALARSGDADLLPHLLEAFLDRDADARVMQSLAIAMGRLAHVDDAQVVDALLDYVQEGRDAHTRHFALVALGEVGGRGPGPRPGPVPESVPEPGAVETSEDQRAASESAARSKRILDALLKEMAGKGTARQDRSWGALAAALFGRGDESVRPRLFEQLRVAYTKESDPAFKGAYAVALGLLNDADSAAVLMEDYQDVHDERFRGHVAVALGLMDHREVSELLRSLCVGKATPQQLRVEAAMGLGLMGDRDSVHSLVSALESDPPLAVVAGLAKAVGLIGDSATIDPLRQLAQSDARPSLSRAFACVALGLLGARSELPFQTRILGHENYLSDSRALAHLKEIL